MHINEAERKPHLEVLDVAPTELEQTEALHQQDAAEVACDTEEPFKEARKMADLPCDKDSLFQCLLYLLGIQRTPDNIHSKMQQIPLQNLSAMTTTLSPPWSCKYMSSAV